MYETQRGNGVGITVKIQNNGQGRGIKYIRTDGQQTDVMTDTQASRQASGRHILRQNRHTQTIVLA